MSENGPPPGKKWHTREDSGIRLDREGRWWHDDEPVEHPRIIEAFNQGLQPDDQGRFILRFGNDWCVVQVEDAAYRVTAVDLENNCITLRLSDRSSEPLDPAALSLDSDGVLHCKVKQGRAWARFSRDAQFQLGEALEENDEGIALRTADGARLITARKR
ncbi:MAG: DUF1285 domain-containing protein [Myxococcaceae bacterium]